MRTLQYFAALIAILVTASSFAEEASAAQQIAASIKQLESDDFDTRQNASRQLLAAGKPAMDALNAALQQQPSVEIQARARQLLAVVDGATGPVNGLKIELRADRTTVAPGEAIKFTILLTNISDAPIHPSTQIEGWIRYGMAFRVLTLNPDTLENDVAAPVYVAAPVCGLTALPEPSLLKPGASKVFESKLFFATADHMKTVVPDHPDLGDVRFWRKALDESMDCFLLRGGMFRLDVPRGGTHRIAVGFSNDQPGYRPEMPHWQGHIQSSAIEVSTKRE